jgi:hypothetical protein
MWKNTKVWFAGVKFAECAIKYANFQAFEAVRLRRPFYCDSALRHRMFAAQSFEFCCGLTMKGHCPTPDVLLCIRTIGF